MPVAREQFIVDARGKKTAVVLPWTRYQQLLEDLHDLAMVAERRKEKSVPLALVRRQLKADGLL